MISAAGLLLAVASQGNIWLLVLSFTISQMAQRSLVGVFWAMPPQFLGGTAAAAGIALINSIANLGGFAGPALIGALHDVTGGYTGGLLVPRVAGTFPPKVPATIRDPFGWARGGVETGEPYNHAHV